MTFLTLIIKNIWRAKIRTILTVLGIALGVATILIFGLLTSGMVKALDSAFNQGTADFTVAKAEAADIVLSFLDEEQVETIRQTEGVAEIAPVMMTVTPFENNPFFIVYGIDAEGVEMFGFHLIEGRAHQADNEIMVGRIASRNRQVGIGDTVTLQDQPYNIVGIFESGMFYQDAAFVTTIAVGQQIQGIRDQVNMVSVSVEEGYDIREVASAVEAADRDLVAIVDPSDFQAIDQGMGITQAFSWAISLLAVVIGGIGVMNTIIMSVFERTREIGVLRAVGWSRGKVARMIVGESLMVGLLAVIPGIVFALAVIWGLQQTAIGMDLLAVHYDPFIFLQALVVSLAVVLFGSLYPAWRASKLMPIEALRYE